MTRKARRTSRARRAKGSSPVVAPSRRTASPGSGTGGPNGAGLLLALVAALALVVVVGAVILLRSGNESETVTPPLDPAAVSTGETLFRANCAQCHGVDLRGTDSGPPFLVATYAPNHHGDEAFQSAVANGVPPHHWNFGPMPAISGLSRDEVAQIVTYIRSEQVGAGIVNDPSHP